MYVRQVVALVVGLYTSRLVFRTLGVSDFGLYGVVGGILTMFSFMSVSLGITTSRFLNTEMGRPGGDVNRVFNVNVVLHAGLAVVVFLLAQTVGLWYVLCRLNVEAGKLPDAVFVYEVCVATACLGIINLPYRGVLASHERFGFLSLLDILNTFLRLGGVLALACVDARYALRAYAVVMSVSTVSCFVAYWWYSHRRWPDIVRLRLIMSGQSYRAVLMFGNWNLLSMFSRMARSASADLMLNSFFGTFVNGSYSISKTVVNNVASFPQNIDGVGTPQIIQAYAAGESRRCFSVAVMICKLSLLVFLVFFFPLYIELAFVLRLWLGDVPHDAVVFTRLQLLVQCVATTGCGVSAVVNASGDIKCFSVAQFVFDAVSILAGCCLLYCRYPAASVLLVFGAGDILYRVWQVAVVSRRLHFDGWRFVRRAYLRPAFVAVIMSLLLLGYGRCGVVAFGGRVAAILGCLVLTAALCYFVGMTKSERASVLSVILKRG